MRGVECCWTHETSSAPVTTNTSHHHTTTTTITTIQHFINNTLPKINCSHSHHFSHPHYVPVDFSTSHPPHYFIPMLIPCPHPMTFPPPTLFPRFPHPHPYPHTHKNFPVPNPHSMLVKMTLYDALQFSTSRELARLQP